MVSHSDRNRQPHLKLGVDLLERIERLNVDREGVEALRQQLVEIAAELETMRNDEARRLLETERKRRLERKRRSEQQREELRERERRRRQT